MAINLNGFVTWLTGWFYKKEEVNTLLNAKVNQNQGQAGMNVVTDSNGNITVENKPTIPDITGKADKTGGVQQITDNNAHSNIGTTANATQGQINTAIDNKISELSSINAIEVVSVLPDPVTEENMGKLYIISENGKVNVYYAVRSGTSPNYSYSFHKMDTDILDDLNIDWSEILNNPFANNTPSDFANAVHQHSASQVVDSNAHTHIGTARNDTQSTINTAIDNEINNIKQSLQARKVFYYTDPRDIPTSLGNTNYEALYIINDIYSQNPTNELRLYYWTDDETTPYADWVLKYITLAKQDDIITSIALVPKNTDANGKIIFYTGDEPT